MKPLRLPTGAALAALALLLGGCNFGKQATQVVANPVPQPPVAAIPHDCTTSANAKLNPDPSRYLAVVAEDAGGAPIANTQVTFSWYGPQGGNIGFSSSPTDAHGAATSLDVSSLPIPPGSSDGMIGIDGTASTPALFTACGNLTFPGTVTVSAGDAKLSTVTLKLHDGSTALAHTSLLMGYTWNGDARLDAGFTPGAGGQARVLDGSYVVAVAGQAGGASYLLYQPLTVKGATTLDVDASAAPSYHLKLSGTDAAGDPGSASLGVFRQASGLKQGHGLGSTTPDTYLTPGSYDVNASLALRPSFNTTWYYGFTKNKVSFGPAGGSGTLAFGGPLTATLTASQASVAPGGIITLSPTVKDGGGYNLYRVSSLDPTNGSQPAKLTIEVDGPSGTMVEKLVSPYLSDDQVNLQSNAVSGTYTATFTWPLGPYQKNALTATTTFQVK